MREVTFRENGSQKDWIMMKYAKRCIFAQVQRIPEYEVRSAQNYYGKYANMLSCLE